MAHPSSKPGIETSLKIFEIQIFYWALARFRAYVMWGSKLYLWCLKAAKFIENDAPNLFVFTDLDDRTFYSASKEYSVLLLKAAARYLLNPARS